MMVRHRLVFCFTCSFALMCMGAASADVSLSTIISDHAVLQRDMPVTIWGMADRGEAVVVSYAGQTRRTEADRLGRWRLKLAPMAASNTGRKLVVRGATNTIEVHDVYVGDVWLYLSQSFHLNSESPWHARESHSDELPPISFCRRSDLFEQRTHSRRPQDEYYIGGDGTHGWNLYQTPGKYFANDAWYLGLGLGRVTGLPVGIMGLGGTHLESMTPPEGFKHYPPELADVAQRVAISTPTTTEGRRAYLEAIRAIQNWVAETRSVLDRPDVTYEDLTQPPLLPGFPDFERGPTTQYNNIIHRFMPATVRGVILQTNQFDVGDPHYDARLRALIRGLREIMGQEELPFCIVQMHSPDKYEQNATDDTDDWTDLRQAQMAAMQSEPNVTVVATYDIGPEDRETISTDRALRASQWAVALVNESRTQTGPRYKKHRIEVNRCVVDFDHLGQGLMVGNKRPTEPVRLAAGTRLGGFQVAGVDGKWHDATATIRDDEVVVWSADVPNPIDVRYAWKRSPVNANLYNRDGFPALPFTTGSMK